MSRPALPCCEPWYRQFPSGGRWLHDRRCKVAPGRKIDERAMRLIDNPGYVSAHIDDEDDDAPYGFDREWVGE